MWSACRWVRKMASRFLSSSPDRTYWVAEARPQSIRYVCPSTTRAVAIPVRSGSIGGPACVPSSTTSSFPLFPGVGVGLDVAPAALSELLAANPAIAASPPAPTSTERRLNWRDSETAVVVGSHKVHNFGPLSQEVKRPIGELSRES